MDEKTCDITLANIKPGDWFKLNPSFVGFYRVLYSPEDLERLCAAIKTKNLSPLDRLNVLDDVFSLISAGQAQTVDGLRLLQAFKGEDSYVVWNIISNSIKSLNIILADQTYYCHFQRFVLDLFSEIRKKMRWAGEEEMHTETLLRSLVLTTLGKYGEEEVRAMAKRMFDKLANGKEEVKADLRSTVYACTAAAGGEADFNTMVALFRSSDLQEEKSRLMRSGLAGFNNKQILRKSLEFAISDDVRPQDSVTLISCIAANSQGRDLAWQFFKDNFQTLKDRYKSGFLLGRLVQSVTEQFLTLEMAETVEHFFQENPLPGSERKVSQAVETIRLNCAWLARDANAIKKFFANL